jgi:hypothetical protein
MRMIQIERTTPTTNGTIHCMDWVDEGLKLKPGDTYPIKGDDRPWKVARVYTLIPREVSK